PGTIGPPSSALFQLALLLYSAGSAKLPREHAYRRSHLMTFAPTPPPPAPPTPPAEKRPRRFSRTQRLVMAGGLTAGLAPGGAGISFAASSGSSSTTTPPSTSKPSTPNAPNTPATPGRGPHGFGFGFGKGAFGFGGLGRVVHGQATVRTNSGYETIVFQ